MAPAQNYFPISELSAYATRWTICARVTNKSQLRTFKRNNGEGKVFSLDLLDVAGGEIRANFFGDAADKYFEKLQKGKCFTFSKGTTKVANQRFNNCKHRYELTFDKGAEIEEVEDDKQIESVKFSFTDLRSVQTKELPCNVDVCGVISSFKPMFSFTSKDGRELVKRDITVVDDTATSMVITIWGDRAKQEDKVFGDNPIACFKGVVVKEWNDGRQGSLTEQGHMALGADGPEAKRVSDWWASGGATQTHVALSVAGGAGGTGPKFSGKPMSLEAVRTATERVGDQPETFATVCRLALVQTTKQGEQQPLFYMACQEPREGSNLTCNRRLDSSGMCASCGKAGKAAPRLNIRCRFIDYADSMWLTTFHEGAQRVLDVKAEDLQAMEAGPGGREAVLAAVKERYFAEPLQVTVRAKLDNYNGEPRTNATAIDVRPVARGERGRVMLQEINEMLAARD